MPIPAESDSQPVGDAAVARRILREYHQRGIDPGSFQRLAGSVHGASVTYLVTAADGQRLVVRACRADAPVPVQFRRSSRSTPLDWLVTRAATLDYLDRGGYPAPRLVRTRSGDMVGLDGVWLTLATSYVEGAVLRPSVEQLGMLGGALGRLHSLEVVAETGPGQAVWYPDEAIPVTLARLDRVAGLLPPGWQEMYAAFRETVLAVRSALGGTLPGLPPGLPRGLVHGDAWAANAVQTGPKEVTLIDWECAGLGLPVLDLGNCLLECLLDAEPGGVGPEAWHVQPDEDRIAAVAAGYAAWRVLSPAERAVLLPAVRFGTAYAGAIHFEQALVDGVRGAAMDARLERLRNRLAVSESVARLAARHLAGNGKPVR